MDTLLIDGTWRASREGQSLDVADPCTGAPFAQLARGMAVDVDDAVRAARTAFEGPWHQWSAAERGRLLARMAVLVARHADELAAVESRDTGKPLVQARAEFDVVSRYFEFYAGAADKFAGAEIPFLPGHTAIARREPVGVTAHVIPWNYPAVMFARTIAPTLAVGNAAVLKPAEDACLSSLRLAQLLLEAGLPPGVLNVVTGLGEEAGGALAAHADIDFITFTGSPQVGTLIQQAAARHHTPCVLELGGKSPQILFEDADIETALPSIVNAIIQNAGQTCSAGSRLLIARSRYAEWLERVAERFSDLTVGPPSGGHACGPLINAAQLDRVRAFVARACGDGVQQVAAGSIAADADSRGYFYAPALLSNVPRDHPIAREEVFGPVLCALPFDDEADAVALANATPYGLVTGVWTQDGSRQTRVAQRVRSGQVFINCYGAGGGVELPFGGFGRSGHGREKGLAALEALTAIKTVVQRYE
ncbi:aldehyde dehydrogenase family protein [Chitinasiproducens palmae]|uniref:Aldehyde dehydrogenase (NAD+) n=1 Tax=Chitinasiproducens palmae TaxID=1770053 RepID=A0A1H2PQ31_9BURK|nr:aldehyde dehydrogenase family protein [Chitinasiproducens palmae]SDV48895.1 aldehyde dehydrogenase (NAD+) [Chitinasiproducens palmae]